MKEIQYRDKIPKHYIINLDKSSDRWKAISTGCLDQGVEFVRVDGYNAKKHLKNDQKVLDMLDKRQRELVQGALKAVQFRGKRPLHQDHGVGSIGCYISHIRAIQKFYDSGKPYAVIMEDDVKIPTNYRNTFRSVSFPPQWDFIIIGPFGCTPQKGKTMPMIRDIYDSTSKDRFIKTDFFLCNTYLVSRKGAKKILDIYKPIKEQWDWFISDTYKNSDLNVWIKFRPVTSLQKFSSTIKHTQVADKSLLRSYKSQDISKALNEFISRRK